MVNLVDILGLVLVSNCPRAVSLVNEYSWVTHQELKKVITCLNESWQDVAQPHFSASNYIGLALSIA